MKKKVLKIVVALAFVSFVAFTPLTHTHAQEVPATGGGDTPICNPCYGWWTSYLGLCC